MMVILLASEQGLTSFRHLRGGARFITKGISIRSFLASGCWSFQVIALVLTCAGLIQPPGQIGKAKDGPAREGAIDNAIGGLGSTRFIEREAANRALLEMGLAALPALKKAKTNGKDPEVRGRAEMLIAAIERAHEAELAYDWFDSLELLDLAKCPLVEVATGYTSSEKGKPDENYYEECFLLNDDGKRFVVLTMDLERLSVTKTAAGVSEATRIGYETVDLEKQMTAFLRIVRQSKEDRFLHDLGPSKGSSRRLRSSLPEISIPAELFLRSRACAAHGLPRLAKEYFDQAKRGLLGSDTLETQVAMLRVRQRHEGGLNETTFLPLLSVEICEHQWIRCSGAFQNASMTRKEICAKYRWIQKHFPKSAHAQEARGISEILGKMVEEDETHLRQLPRAHLNRQEQISDLIFGLRDQTCNSDLGIGFCDIFQNREPRDPTNYSPADRLAEIGYDAVPQLLAALEDERLTRAEVFTGHRMSGKRVILRAGDCALRILQRIFGTRFDFSNDAFVANGNVQGGRLVRTRAEEWWKNFQQAGERQMWIAGVEAGDWNSREQAERLVNKYPDIDTLKALRKGITRQKDDPDWVTKDLVVIAARLPGEMPVALLREQLKCSVVEARVAAAQGLQDHGHDGIQAMIQEWAELDEWQGSTEVAEFLIRCGKIEGVRALAKDVRRHSPNQVIAAIGALRTCASKDVTVQREIDELLIYECDDTRNSDQRVCDASAEALAKRMGRSFKLDSTATPKARDRQIWQLKNAWLAKHGLKPSPPPAQVIIKRLPDEQVLPFIGEVVYAQAKEACHEAAGRLVALGLGALPAIRENDRLAPPGHPAELELKRVTAQISVTVQEAQFEKESIKPPADLNRKVSGWRGEPLTAQKVVDLVVALLSKPPSEVGGIRLQIDREGDNTGVRVSIGLLPRRRNVLGVPGKYIFEKFITVNGKGLYGTMGSHAAQGLADDIWFARYLQNALDGPIDTCLEVRLTAWEEK
jgi:hypothetical protein